MLPTVKRVRRMPTAYRPLIDLLSDVLMTSDELCSHWRYTPTHVCNLRKRGKVPFIKLYSGAIRYRMSEIIEAEVAGTLGTITVEQICLVLAACEKLSPKDREIAQAHIRSAFAVEVPRRQKGDW